MTSNVDAVLMASGASRRFGTDNKLLFPFQNKPLATHTLELVCGTNLFNRIFFIAADSSVLQLAEGFPVVTIYNTKPSRGSCESIRLGVLSSTAPYYMFFTCDQPLLDENTLQNIISAKKEGHIIVPQYNHKSGSPNLFSSSFREELLALQDHQPAKDIKKRHPDKIIPVSIENKYALFDVDTLTELEFLEGFHDGKRD